MKKISVCIFLFFIAAGISFSDVAKKDVFKILASYKNTTGKFEQVKSLKKMNRELKSSGKFIFCPKGIVWHTEKPFSSAITITGDYMVQFSSDGSKNVIEFSEKNITAREIFSAVSSIYSSNLDAIEKNFDVEFNSKGDGWNVVLNPKDKTMSSMICSIKIEGLMFSHDAEILSMEMNESSGEKISYRFMNQNHPLELSEDEKEFFEK